MVTDRQVRRLMELFGKGKSLAASAAKADMDESKYRELGKLPSEIKVDHPWRTREDLFPTHGFRMANDWLKRGHPSRAVKEYRGILHLAARQNEAGVDYALRTLIEKEQSISIGAVETIMGSLEQILPLLKSPSQMLTWSLTTPF